MKVFRCFIGVVILLVLSLSANAQPGSAPDCDACDALLADPDAYALCMTENDCNSVPVSGHLWILVAAVGLVSVRLLYKK